MQNNVPQGPHITAQASEPIGKKFICLLSGGQAELHDGSLKEPYLALEAIPIGESGTLTALVKHIPVRVKSAVAHVQDAPGCKSQALTGPKM